MGVEHRWDLEPGEAVALQKDLRKQIDVSVPLNLDDVELVAGVDVSVKNDISRAAVVVMSYPELATVETETAAIPTPFPYISGLLTFREGEVILEAWSKLQHKPDAVIFDGQGYAHPRRLGIATHMGLWLDVPTAGCGKTKLVGTIEGELPEEKGSSKPLTHRGEQVGYLLRTRTRVKPVYVSAGHLMTHEAARTLVLSCTTRYRLPEPIRAADRLAGQFLAK
ncbi:MAG: deoxyribonuclease V [Chloroflexi bacterium]|nr:deoxyribonuclease V [Chloroflexota bacterium]